jgi:hypothetical protein
MTPPRIYIDACCFIDVVKEKVGLPLQASDHNDMWYLQNLLRASGNGEIIILTSTITIAECTHADGNCDDAVRENFTKLLSSGQYVRLIQPTVFVCEKARDLRWKHGITLPGADAIHVASALESNCIEFLGIDKRKKNDQEKIEKLGIKLISPAKTSVLPDHYRQGNMLEAPNS